MAWGFARLGHRSENAERLFSGVAKELIRRTWQFKPQDIGTTLWSMATAEYFDHDAFRAGASRLNLRQIRTFKVCVCHNYVKRIFVRFRCSPMFDLTLISANSHRKCPTQCGRWPQQDSPLHLFEHSTRLWSHPLNDQQMMRSMGIRLLDVLRQ